MMNKKGFTPFRDLPAGPRLPAASPRGERREACRQELAGFIRRPLIYKANSGLIPPLAYTSVRGRRSLTGFTLVEIMVVVGLMAVLVSSFLGVLLNSGTFWDKGENKITEQYEARLGMDVMVKDLRESNTYWGITVGSNQILFYKPRFDDSGNFNGTYWVGYKLNPDNLHQLARKEQGDTAYTPVANYIETVAFAGSTDGCQTFDNLTVPSDCPRIRITITTNKERNFTLTTDVVLRNQYTAVAGEPPVEGEF